MSRLAFPRVLRPSPQDAPQSLNTMLLQTLMLLGDILTIPLTLNQQVKHL